MVFVIDGVKFACAYCIRGHRVKKCNHSKRPLIQIQKRGRQASGRCTHCRSLSKYSKAPIKCTCATSARLNPENGCLYKATPVRGCVAYRTHELTEDELTNLKSTTLSPNLTPSPSISSHSTQSLVTPSNSNHTVNMPHIPTELPMNMSYAFNSAIVSDLYYNNTTNFTFMKEDAELIDFLFNDLDNFLPPNSEPVAPHFI